MSDTLKDLGDAVYERLDGKAPMIGSQLDLYSIVRAVLDELAERGYLVVDDG